MNAFVRFSSRALRSPQAKALDPTRTTAGERTSLMNVRAAIHPELARGRSESMGDPSVASCVTKHLTRPGYLPGVASF